MRRFEGRCKCQRILRAPGGSSPIQRMLHDDWLLAYYGMGRNCLKIESSECTMLWSLCLLRFKKNIEKNYRLDYYSGQFREKKTKKKNYRLDYWSGHGRTNRTVCYGPANWCVILYSMMILECWRRCCSVDRCRCY